MLNGLSMTPSQMIRISFGDSLINVPLFRMPYIGGQDSSLSPGGFFTDPEGELGILVDSRLPPHEVQDFISSEIQKNVSLLTTFLETRTHNGISFTTSDPPSNLPS